MKYKIRMEGGIDYFTENIKENVLNFANSLFEKQLYGFNSKVFINTEKIISVEVIK